MILHIYLYTSMFMMGYHHGENLKEFGSFGKISWVDWIATILTAFLWPVNLLIYLYWNYCDR